jgi:chemotaxis protein MotB
MARKKRNEERENHDRWLVSYADFITLLFAFFVVMYSISSVNEGKYRVLSDSMVAAFRDPTRSLVPIQVGDLMRAPVQSETLLDSQKPIIDIFKVPLPGRYGA